MDNQDRLTREEMIVGTKGLNEKRDEITAVVGTLIGLLKHRHHEFQQFVLRRGQAFCPASAYLETWPSDSGVMSWLLQQHGDEGVSARLICAVNGAYVYKYVRGQTPDLACVRQVYDALPRFYDAMFREFPVLHELTSHIRDEAAERRATAPKKDTAYLLVNGEQEFERMAMSIDSFVDLLELHISKEEVESVQVRLRKNDRDYIHLQLVEEYRPDGWNISIKPTGDHMFITCRSSAGKQIYWNEGKVRVEPENVAEVYARLHELLEIVRMNFPLAHASLQSLVLAGERATQR